jgi:hypothetical protein
MDLLLNSIKRIRRSKEGYKLLNLTKALELTIKAKEDPRAILELENLIKEAIAVENAKNNNKINAFRALNKIIKENRKKYPDKIQTHGAWIEPFENKQYITNGYYIIEINQPIEGLPQLGPDVEPPINGRKLFADTIEKANYEEVFINISDLKKQFKIAQVEAKIAKAEIDKIPSGQIKIGASWYPVNQLIDIINTLGEDIRIYTEKNCNKPCLLISNTGRALIMPINKQ